MKDFVTPVKNEYEGYEEIDIFKRNIEMITIEKDKLTLSKVVTNLGHALRW